MHILIDADGCPVTKIAARVAAEYKIPSTVMCGTAHRISIPGAEVVTVDQGADSVDFRLVNMIRKGEIAVTQDYGLAAMCLPEERSCYIRTGSSTRRRISPACSNSGLFPRRSGEAAAG